MVDLLDLVTAIRKVITYSKHVRFSNPAQGTVCGETMLELGSAGSVFHLLQEDAGPTITSTEEAEAAAPRSPLRVTPGQEV